VVSITETVVYERTMVVEVFDAATAEHAVEGCLSFYKFVVGAKVDKVETVVQEFFG